MAIGRFEPPKGRQKKPHLIDDISFSKDYIVCDCAWKGPIDDFKQHRKDAIAKDEKAA